MRDRDLKMLGRLNSSWVLVAHENGWVQDRDLLNLGSRISYWSLARGGTDETVLAELWDKIQGGDQWDVMAELADNWHSPLACCDSLDLLDHQMRARCKNKHISLEEAWTLAEKYNCQDLLLRRKDLKDRDLDRLEAEVRAIKTGDSPAIACQGVSDEVAFTKLLRDRGQAKNYLVRWEDGQLPIERVNELLGSPQTWDMELFQRPEMADVAKEQWDALLIEAGNLHTVVSGLARCANISDALLDKLLNDEVYDEVAKENLGKNMKRMNHPVTVRNLGYCLEKLSRHYQEDGAKELCAVKLLDGWEGQLDELRDLVDDLVLSTARA